jgi:hypothetical protein
MTRVVRCARSSAPSCSDTFRFHPPSTVYRVDAAGILKRDLMEVRYSEIMQYSDFENAAYRRVQ